MLPQAISNLNLLLFGTVDNYYVLVTQTARIRGVTPALAITIVRLDLANVDAASVLITLQQFEIVGESAPSSLLLCSK